MYIKSLDGIGGYAMMTVLVFLPPSVSRRQRLFALAAAQLLSSDPMRVTALPFPSLPAHYFPKGQTGTWTPGQFVRSNSVLMALDLLGKRGWRDGLTCQTATLPWPKSRPQIASFFFLPTQLLSLDSDIHHQKHRCHTYDLLLQITFLESTTLCSSSALTP